MQSCPLCSAWPLACAGLTAVDTALLSFTFLGCCSLLSDDAVYRGRPPPIPIAVICWLSARCDALSFKSHCRTNVNMWMWYNFWKIHFSQLKWVIHGVATVHLNEFRFAKDSGTPLNTDIKPSCYKMTECHRFLFFPGSYCVFLKQMSMLM